MAGTPGAAPPEVERAVKALVSYYAQAEIALRRELETLATFKGPMDREFVNVQLARVRQVLAELQFATAREMETVVVGSYVGRVRETTQRLIDSGAVQTMGDLSALDGDAVALLVQNATQRTTAVNTVIGRRVDDTVRQVALRQMALKAIKRQTVRDAADDLQDAMQREGLIRSGAFKTGKDAGTPLRLVQLSGRNYRAEEWAELTARTTSREAQSHATVNTMARYDMDLVQVVGHNNACSLCAPHKNVVYSLSGKTPGYPVLGEMPPFHPHCRDNLIPYLPTP